MEHYIGIDVSLELSSVCVLDAAGAIMREAKVLSEPEALVRFVAELEVPIAAIGLEAGPLSAWLHDGLKAAGHEVVLLETRQVKAALSAMAVKTDRRDARGIAQCLAHGVVPLGPPEVGELAGGARASGGAQAASADADRPRADDARGPDAALG